MSSENSVTQLLKDLEPKKGISEIIINNPDSIYIERVGELIQLNTEITMEDLNAFCMIVAKFNQMNFDRDNPILDGILPDGSRINMISPYYTDKAPAITIRKYQSAFTRLDELEGKFGLTDKWVRFFKAMVNSKANVLVSGGTNMGKTTFLNLLVNEVSLKERMVIIEDTKEIKCDHPNKASLLMSRNNRIQTPLSMRHLVKNSLRMRPDRIVIGEVRGEEAFDMLQAMNTGHDGSMGTLHANTAIEAISRLESLFTYAGHDIPIPVIRKQISLAIDFIVQLKRSRTGERIVSQVYEITGMEGDVIVTQSIGEETDNGPAFTGLVPKNVAKMVEFGVDNNFFLI